MHCWCVQLMVVLQDCHCQAYLREEGNQVIDLRCFCSDSAVGSFCKWLSLAINYMLRWFERLKCWTKLGPRPLEICELDARRSKFTTCIEQESGVQNLALGSVRLVRVDRFSIIIWANPALLYRTWTLKTLIFVYGWKYNLSNYLRQTKPLFWKQPPVRRK
jgi:hypothetical protein